MKILKKNIVIIFSIALIFVLAKGSIFAYKFRQALKYEESSCVLKGIGNASVIYMHENIMLPDTLELLFAYDNIEEPPCPICHRKYMYFGKGITDVMSPELIIAIDDCKSDGKGYQIALSDGRSKYYIKPDEMLEYLEADQKCRDKHNLEQIPLNKIRYTDNQTLLDYYKSKSDNSE